VSKAIDILKNELSVTMALTGTNRITDIGPQVIVGGETKKRAHKRKG
jgi:isopentenyl diphosphate isomerase/L-lactate dehydrogenase-like FMN-dependent dehydrogenase